MIYLCLSILSNSKYNLSSWVLRFEFFKDSRVNVKAARKREREKGHGGGSVYSITFDPSLSPLIMHYNKLLMSYYEF